MSTPPPEQQPPEQAPHGQRPEQHPPQQLPPPGQQTHLQLPHRQPAAPGLDVPLLVGMVVVGAVAFVGASVAAVAFLVGEVWSLGAFAVLSVVVAFGGGLALVSIPRTWARGLGLGLMIGWALVVLFTAGLCVAVLQTY